PKLAGHAETGQSLTYQGRAFPFLPYRQTNEPGLDGYCLSCLVRQTRPGLLTASAAIQNVIHLGSPVSFLHLNGLQAESGVLIPLDDSVRPAAATARWPCRSRVSSQGGPLRVLSKYLSVTDVQRELGLSAAQVQYLIDSRRLPAFRVFGKWRIERELLEQMVDNLYEADLHEEESRADIGGGEQAGQQPMAESAT